MYRAGAILIGSTIALAACAPPLPTQPSFLATPGDNKTGPQFSADDAKCRSYANGAVNGTNPAQAGNQAAAGSTVAGAATGAAAGALVGAASGHAGAGAAVGAGLGLLVGAAAGARNGAYSAAAVQQTYDMAYGQCMIASGDHVPVPQYATPVGYPAYPYPYPYYAYPYPYVVGVGGPVFWYGWRGGWGWGGWGWGGWRGGWRH